MCGETSGICCATLILLLEFWPWPQSDPQTHPLSHPILSSLSQILLIVNVMAPVTTLLFDVAWQMGLRWVDEGVDNSGKCTANHRMCTSYSLQHNPLLCIIPD